MREEWCKGCNLCLEICPRGVFITSSEISKKGFKTIKVGNEDACIGCSLCEYLCPDLVITVEEEQIAGKD